MPAATRIKRKGARRLPALLVAMLVLAAGLVLGGLKAGAAASGTCTSCVTVKLSADHTTITSGGTVNVTVTVTPTANTIVPTGIVSLVDANGQNHGSGTLVNGTVTFAATSMTAGTWVVHATYPGDNNYFSNDSSTLTITVNPQLLPQTSIDAFTATPSTITAGDSMTFNVHVTNLTSPSTPPVGTITLLNSTGGCLTTPPCAQADLDSNGNAQLTVQPPEGTTSVTASFQGSQYQSSTKQIPITVNPNTTSLIDTTTTVLANGGAVTVDDQTDVNLVATVTQSHLTIPAAGDYVTFFKKLDGTSQQELIDSAPISWNGTVGTASLDAGKWVKGSYTVEADFIGFDNLGTSSGTARLSVYPQGSKQPTTISYVGDATDFAGQPDNIAFELMGPNNTPIAGKSLTITVAGQIYTATTNGNGVAAVTPTLPAGAYDKTQITAHFDGSTDALYLSSDGAGALVVSKIPTATTVGTIANTNVGASTTLSATLTDTGTSTSPVPVSGKTVTLSFGTDSCTGTTKPDGTVSCTISPVTTAPGSYTVTASFAGDDAYLASSSGVTGNTIVVAKGVTAVVDNVSGNFLQGSTATLSGTLTAYGNPLANETLTLTFGGVSCTGTTDATGTASCGVTVPGPSGTTTTYATFAGDASYQPASDNQPALVYAYAPGGGSFVVGDQSDTGSVYFWGSQWAKQNSLSAADPKNGDNAFKGFADSPATPSCNTNWAANPGNSSKPPAGPLPAYMAVIVTDHDSKSGAVTSGDTVSIVIVKTSPGYKNDPGHAGTGTVVATLCTGTPYAAPPVSCSAKGTKCESLLANPSTAQGATVTAGQTLSILYTDDQPISGTATVTLDGSALPVTLTATSGKTPTYVDTYGGSKATKSQSLISFTVPSGLASGTHTIVVTAQDGDNDYDVYSWTITV